MIKQAPDENRISGDIAQQSFAIALMQTDEDGFFELRPRVHGPIHP
jgi:hypothetical protein